MGGGGKGGGGGMGGGEMGGGGKGVVLAWYRRMGGMDMEAAPVCYIDCMQLLPAARVREPLWV